MGDPSRAAINGEGVEAAEVRERPNDEPSHFLADVLPEQVWTANTSGELDFANRRMLDYSGRSFEEMVGHGWQQIVHPDDLPRTLERWKKAFEVGETCEVEFRLRRADGVYRWHVGRAQPQRDAEGRVIRWFGYNTDIDDRRRAEAEALRLQREEAAREEAEAAQEKIANILSSITDAFFALDDEWRFTYINPKAEEVWGERRKDLIGKNIWEAFPEAVGSVAYEEITRAAAEQETVAFETKSPVFERWIDVRIYPSEDGLSVYFQDITERKQAEAALARVTAESERQKRLYEAILSSTPDLVYIFDLDYRFTYANDALLQMWGRTLEESIGKRLLEVGYEPWHAEMHEREIDEVIATKQPVRGEVAFPHATLGRRTYDYIFVPVLDAEGEVEAVAGTTRDVTERKRAEEALRESESRTRLALGVARLGTWSWDPERDEVRADPRCREICGLNPDAALTLADIGPRVHPDDWPRIEAALEAALQPEGSGRYAEELRFVHIDGTVRWVVSRGQTLFEKEGESRRPTLMLGTILDITERKAAEEELRESKEKAEAANRAKSAFLANMSHEIRTPLTSIVGFTSFLAQQLSGKQLKYVEMIERSGKRLLDTLNALLMLARLEAKGMEIDFEDVNVADEAERVAGLSRPKAEEKGLALEHIADTGARPPLARLDGGALNSILQNLISNAIKFTEGGRVTVTTEVAEHAFPNSNDAGAVPAVCVRVEDTGSGIDSGFLKRIFESFEQESSGWGRSHEGSGLGLSITRKLVALMNGAISVESEKGEGSAFTVAFPLTAKEGAASPTDEVRGNSTVPSDARILVVEDQEEARLLAQDVLGDAGEVRAVATSAAALEAARTVPFDLVLVDINLGTLESGIDVLHALRTMPGYGEVPVVAVTAYALPGDREDFLQEGFDAYLGKPFMADELIRLTGTLLQA